METKNNKIFDL